MVFAAFLQVCAIKAPGFGENRKSGLQDLAVLTGGQVSFLFAEVTTVLNYSILQTCE